MYRRIDGVNWYYRLKENDKDGKIQKGLFSDYPRNSIDNEIIISWSYLDSKNKNTILRLYGIFNSFLDFGKYMYKLPQYERCFYEVVLGERLQKPHFDIDIDLNDFKLTTSEIQNIMDNLITAIVEFLTTLNIELNLNKDICIYSSHGNNKISYHIIINNYCHSNNKEAKAFYDKVMEKLPKEYFENNWVDPKVYSKSQQFRCYGCQKIGTYRIKILNNIWKYKNQTIHHKYEEIPEDERHLFILQLDESIITARSNCKLLPKLISKIDKILEFESSEDITMEQTKLALELLANKGGFSWDDKINPYKFDKIDGPFIVLKRIKSSRCRICNRIHDHQNPYLWINSTDNSIYFHCRRAPIEKKLYLGKINQEIELPKENKEDNKNQNKNNVEKEKTKSLHEERLKHYNLDLEKVKSAASQTTSFDKKIKKPFDYNKETNVFKIK